MPKITESELLLISKAKLEKLRSFADGVSLTRRGRSTIDQLRVRAARDRLRLASAQLNDAIKAAATAPPLRRAAVSRAYYAMYHSARAATYLSFGGDDHEEHSALPGKIPTDFPDSEQWRNKLKNARLERNRADYDPYPKDENDFDEACISVLQDAKDLLRIAKKYINLIARSTNGG